MFERKNILALVLVASIAMSGIMTAGTAEHRIDGVKVNPDPYLAGVLAGEKLAKSTADFVTLTHSDVESGTKTMKKWLKNLPADEVDKKTAMQSFNFNYKVFVEANKRAMKERCEIQRERECRRCAAEVKKDKIVLGGHNRRSASLEKKIKHLKSQLSLPGVNVNIRRIKQGKLNQLIHQKKLVDATIKQKELSMAHCATILKDCATNGQDAFEKASLKCQDQLEALKKKYEAYNEKAISVKFMLRDVKDHFKRTKMTKEAHHYEAKARATKGKIASKAKECARLAKGASRFSNKVTHFKGSLQKAEKALEFQGAKSKESKYKKDMEDLVRRISLERARLQKNKLKSKLLGQKMSCILHQIAHTKDVVRKRTLIRHLQVVKKLITRTNTHCHTLKKEIHKKKITLHKKTIHVKGVAAKEMKSCKKRYLAVAHKVKVCRSKIFRYRKAETKLKMKLAKCIDSKQRKQVKHSILLIRKKLHKQKGKMVRCKKSFRASKKEFHKFKRASHVIARNCRRIVRKVRRPSINLAKKEMKMIQRKSKQLRKKSSRCRKDIQKYTIKIEKAKDQLTQTKNPIKRKEILKKIHRFRRNIHHQKVHIRRISKHIRYERTVLAKDRKEIQAQKKRRHTLISCQKAKLDKLKKRGALICKCATSKMAIRKMHHDVKVFREKRHEIGVRKRHLRKLKRNIHDIRRQLKHTKDKTIIKTLKHKLKHELKQESRKRKVIAAEKKYVHKMSKVIIKERTKLRQAKIARRKSRIMIAKQKKVLRKMSKKRDKFRFKRISVKEAKGIIKRDEKKVTQVKALIKARKAKLVLVITKIQKMKEAAKKETDYTKRQKLIRKIHKLKKKEKRLIHKVKSTKHKLLRKEKKLIRARKLEKKCIAKSKRAKAMRKQRKAMLRVEATKRKLFLRQQKVQRLELKITKMKSKVKFTKNKKIKAKLIAILRKTEKKVLKANKKSRAMAVKITKKEKQLNHKLRVVLIKRKQRITKNIKKRKVMKAKIIEGRKKMFKMKEHVAELIKKKCKCAGSCDAIVQKTIKKEIRETKRKMKVQRHLIKHYKRTIVHCKRTIHSNKRFIWHQEKLKEIRFKKNIQMAKKDIHYRESRIKRSWSTVRRHELKLKFTKDFETKRRLKLRIYKLKKFIKAEKKIVNMSRNNVKKENFKFIKLESKRRERIRKCYKINYLKTHKYTHKYHTYHKKLVYLKRIFKQVKSVKQIREIRAKIVLTTRKEERAKKSMYHFKAKLHNARNKFREVEAKRESEYKQTMIKYVSMVKKIQQVNFKLHINHQHISQAEELLAGFERKAKCLGKADHTIRKYLKRQILVTKAKIVSLKTSRHLLKNKLSWFEQRIKFDRQVIQNYDSYYIKKYSEDRVQLKKEEAEEKNIVDRCYKKIDKCKTDLVSIKDPIRRRSFQREIEEEQKTIEKQKAKINHKADQVHTCKVKVKEFQKKLDDLQSREQEKKWAHSMKKKLIEKKRKEKAEKEKALKKKAGAKKLLLI